MIGALTTIALTAVIASDITDEAPFDFRAAASAAKEAEVKAQRDWLRIHHANLLKLLHQLGNI